MAVMAGFMDGYCKVEVYDSGPVHQNVDPGGAVVVKFKACPEHTGELLPSVGCGLTLVPITMVFLLEHRPSVTCRV